MAVYMIRAGEDGPVKIGTANSPQERLYNLQTAHYQKLSIIRLFEGGLAEELALHQRFADLHIRGEWHSFSRTMLGDVGLVEIQVEIKPVTLPRYVFRPVLPDTDPFLAEVEDFLARTRMSATSFGIAAVNDGKFVGRLRAGTNMMLGTITKAREYLRHATTNEAA